MARDHAGARRGFALCVAAAAILVPGSAAANGRFPSANQLVASPSDPDLFVLRATYGVIFSHDHGLNWDWICEQAYGFAGNADPALGLTQNNTVLLGKFDGLAVSPDVGCSWGKEPSLVQHRVTDVVVRPDDPHTAFVAATDLKPVDAGGYAYLVYRSQDDGATWSPWGNPPPPGWTVETIEVAASDPHRLYLSASQPEVLDGGTSAQKLALMTSLDDGQTWSVNVIPSDTVSEIGAFIGAVDPQNPDRVYIRTGGFTPVVLSDGGHAATSTRLLVTDDAGKTMKVVTTLTGQMLGFALSTDGSKVFVGSVEDGLLSAKTSDFAFTQRSSIHVQCLRATPTELWACSDTPSGFVLGVSADEGGSFTPKLQLNGLRQTLKCGGLDSSTAICEPYFEPLCDNQLGGCRVPDAGPVADSGPIIPPPKPPPPAQSSCGCSLGPTGAAGVGGAAFIGSWILLLARRRRANDR